MLLYYFGGARARAFNLLKTLFNFIHKTLHDSYFFFTDEKTTP